MSCPFPHDVEPGIAECGDRMKNCVPDSGKTELPAERRQHEQCADRFANQRDFKNKARHLHESANLIC